MGTLPKKPVDAGADTAELERLLVDTDAELVNAAVAMLEALYELRDQAQRCEAQYARVAAAVRGKEVKPPHPITMHSAHTLFIEASQGLTGVLRGAEVRFSLSGQPERFGPVIQGNRWKAVKR